MNFKKLGLTLSGGGGKGAYQIGVWKALREFGLEREIAAISGTSVGGLNGAMMAQGKYEKAEAMWLNIESRNMLTLQDVDWIASRLGALGAMGAVSPLLMGFIQTKGLFKQAGLQSMIDEGLEPELLATGAIPLTVGLHRTQANRVIYQAIREPRIASDALLATAALPGIFDEVLIDGVSYTDGGFYWGLPHKNLDNTPIKPLVEAGCDTIIVVCLSQDDLNITPRQFPGVRVLPIVLRQSPGGLTATLDFSNKGAEQRMEQGYADANHLLQHLDLFVSNEDQYQALWQRVAAAAGGETSSRSTLHYIDRDHARTASEIGDFDRVVAGDDFTRPIDLAEDDSPPSPLASLALDNAGLLADLERQQIQTDVDGFLTQNQNNRAVVEATVLDALAALSPVSGRADHLGQQGVLARCWAAITGKNQKLAAENDHALAQAQFAALRLIAAVQEKGAITLEFTCALQNRLTGAFREIERQGTRHNQDLRRVYRSLAGVYTQLRNRLIQQESRQDTLERQGRLHHWLLHPNRPCLQGKALSELPVPVRLACLANDFFHLTDGAWRVEELISLKEMCIKVGLDNSAPVRVADSCAALLKDRTNVQALMQRLAEADATAVPAGSAAGWLRDVRNHSLPEAADTEHALVRWNYAADVALPAWDFLAELLYHLKAAGFVPLRHSELGQIKAEWSSQLDTLSGLVHENILPPAFASEIEPVKQAVGGFKLAVPLVGQFSVGKSTLLNTWLGQEIQPQDLGPCTGIATEFHFAEAGQEKMVVHWQAQSPDTTVQREEYPLARYPDLLSGRLAAGRETLFVELHCTLPALARHPDLVLVDTPGLGSNHNRHDQALAHYLGEGVVFILCITRLSQVGKDELAFVERQRALGQGFSLLVCQEDLCNASEREATRRTAAAQASLAADQLVRGCSAREEDLAGFEDILAHIERQKADLFRGRMAPRIRKLIEHAEHLIRQRLSADTNAGQLHDKKAAITKGVAALQECYAQEESDLLRDCGGTITRQVFASVGSFLKSRRSAYASLLLAGQNLGPLLAADAKNAFQMAAEQSLTPRLKEAARTLGKHAQLEAIGQINIGVGGLPGLDGNGMGGAAAGAAAGAAVGSLIPVIGTVFGALCGGFLGFFASRSSQESEAEGQANQAIEAVIAQMQGQIGPALQAHASRFLTAVRQQIEEQLEVEKQNIVNIKQQLQADTQQKQVIEQKAQVALTTVSQLLIPHPISTAQDA